MKSKMVKGILILALFFASGCVGNNKSQEPVIDYNETALKDFVMATHDPDNPNSLHLIDSILSDAAEDPVFSTMNRTSFFKFV